MSRCVFILLFTLSFADLAFSQGGSPLIRTFGLNGYYYGRDIIRCKDSTYIVVGSSDIDSWYNSDALIMRLDSGLNQMLWTKNIGGINVDWATGIAEDSDTTFIVCGYSNSYAANSDYDVRCIKITMTGDIVWQKSYGGNDWDYANAILKLSDGNFLISGKSASNTFGKDNAFAIKINSNGDTLWQKYYATNVNSSFNKAVELSNNNLVFAGYFENELPHTNKDGLIVTTDANGNFIWQQQYGDTLEDELRSVSASKLLNTFWACGYTEGKSGWRGQQKYILKLDYSGNILLQDSVSGAANESYYDVKETEDTAVALINHTTWGGFGKDSQIFKFDRDINFNFASSYGSLNEDLCYNMKMIDRNKFVAVGYTNSYSNPLSSILIIYGFIDQGGTSASTIIDGIKKTKNKENEVHIYPNPFSKSCFIYTSLSHPVCTLIDGMGKIVKRESYHLQKQNAGYEFFNDQLSAGVYFMQVQSEDDVQVLKLIIY